MLSVKQGSIKYHFFESLVWLDLGLIPNFLDHWQTLLIWPVLFQAIQFNVSTQVSSIWSIDRTLSDTTTQGQSEPGSDGNEGVLCIPKFQHHWNLTSNGAVGYTDCVSAERQDPTNKCPEYDTKQSDGEAPVMLELWGMQNTLSLPSLPGSLWPGVVETW